jgi:hypothetical protein
VAAAADRTPPPATAKAPTPPRQRTSRGGDITRPDPGTFEIAWERVGRLPPGFPVPLVRSPPNPAIRPRGP